MPSIVIPAHDEQGALPSLLAALEPLAATTEVVVVANGCTDGTVAVAREAAPWATVIDLPEPGKPAALDAGDAAATTFPRLYLDADVKISAVDVLHLFEAIHSGRPAAAATPSYDKSGSSALVRSHMRFWEALPTNRSALSGTNAMALSREGRARFGDWPRVIGDDYFLDGLFSDAEKTRVPDAHVLRPASSRFRDTVSRKARIAEGNAQVVAAGLRAPHTGGGRGGVKAVLRENPWLAVHLPAHLAVSVATQVLLRYRRTRGTADVWYRDLSRTR